MMERKFKLGIALNTGFTVIQFVFGLLSGSLALISDAAHNLTDSFSMMIAYGGSRLGSKKADASRTYGYGRATILTALLNGIILIGLALYIFYEAYQRWLSPQPVEGGMVVVVALIAIAVNGYVAWTFSKDKSDLNSRGAFLNMAFDTLSSIGVLVGGILILLTGQTIIDPIISAVIGVMLLSAAYGVTKDALHILLEGVPEGVDLAQVKQTIVEHPLIEAVDDLHVWAISSQQSAMSCHVVMKDCDLATSAKAINEIKHQLKERFNVHHATIESELTHCDPEPDA